MPHLFYSKADAVAYAQIKTDKRSPMPHICKFTLVPEMHTLEQVKHPPKTKFRIL